MMVIVTVEKGRTVRGMAEYIDKEAAIEAAKHAWAKGLEPSQYIEIIQDADVSPVRHGKWISLTECSNEGVYCSICKKKVWKSDYICAWCSKKNRNKLRSNYCPNCGAKMDLKEV